MRLLILLALLAATGCKTEATKRREIYDCRQITVGGWREMALMKCLMEKYGWSESEARSVDLESRTY